MRNAASIAPADAYAAPDQSAEAPKRVVVAETAPEAADAPSQSQNSLTNNNNNINVNLNNNNVQDLGISNEALTAALSAQGYRDAKVILPSQEVDPSQFLQSSEGNKIMALLTKDQDGFQIQGSQGTYHLQIQPANGDLGTPGSDGSIPHEQLLSNGLLQNILAAIEQQPQGGQLQISDPAQLQTLQQLPTQQQVQVDLKGAESATPVQQQKPEEGEEEQPQNDQEVQQTVNVSEKSPRSPMSINLDDSISDEDRIALFFGNYGQKINKNEKSES